MRLLFLSLLFLCQLVPSLSLGSRFRPTIRSENYRTRSVGTVSPSRRVSPHFGINSGINGVNGGSAGDDNVENNEVIRQYSTAFPGYRFFRRSSGKADNDNNPTKKNTDSTSFGYVPSGMSREEYANLRKAEAEEQKTKNYGAWGPRFRRTSRPEGDWMVLPNLWTLGRVDYKNGNSNNGTDKSVDPVTARGRIRSLVRAHGPSFVLAYLLMDCLHFGYTLWKIRQDPGILRKSYTLAYGLYRLCVLAGASSGLAAVPKAATKTLAKASASVVGSATTTVALLALKIGMAMLQVPLWNSVMERANRQWLWSRTRFTAVFLLELVAALSVFGFVVLR